MLAKLNSLLKAPKFDDEDITRLADLFNTILIATFAVALLACVGFIIFVPDQTNQLLFLLFVLPLILGMIYLIHQGRVLLAIKIYVVCLWVTLALVTIYFGGIHAPAFTSLIIVVLIAGLLWSGRAGLIFAALTAVFGFAIAVLEMLDLMFMPLYVATPVTTWIAQTGNFILIAFFIYQTRGSLEKALNRARNEVTIRKRTENALRQGEAQLRNVLNTVPEGVVFLDNDGRISLTNPVADTHLSILAPDYDQQDGFLKRLGDFTLDKLLTSPPRGLWHQITANNFLFEAIARPVENTSQNLGWVMVLRDVTQERQIQRQIQQQERLAAVGQLAAGIAHDFNNIMAIIILYAQMISRQKDLTTYVQEKLETIWQQGHRAAELIQQILDFSRQSVLDQHPLDVVPFLKEMVKLFRRTLRENIDIQLTYDQGVHKIFVDPSRIQQVLMNLALNARDAMPEGGKLMISLKQIELRRRQSPPVQGMTTGSWVVINIQDTGFGMSQETISRIFEPFFSTKETGKGTGLGLAQVYGIMKQHSGYLDVESEVDVGTTFSLYFPAYIAEEMEIAHRDDMDLLMGQKQTVLIVEDNLGTRKALRDSLELLNYVVIESENGRDALALLNQREVQVDLIVSDAVMPQMGGIALYRALRESKIGIPMVILTGHPMSNELNALRAEGLSGWLMKPTTLEALSNLLAQALKNNE